MHRDFSDEGVEGTAQRGEPPRIAWFFDLTADKMFDPDDEETGP